MLLCLTFEVCDGRHGVVLEDLPVKDLDVLRLGHALQVVQRGGKHLLSLLKSYRYVIASFLKLY